VAITLKDKQRHFLKFIIENEGYTVEQLVNAYNYGNISDDLFKYGLSLLGFKTSEVL
jgi:hypothetical protein